MASAHRSHVRLPGRRYTFGWGSASRKAVGPAAADIGPIDSVLLSHDHHADNLDDAGRALSPSASVVLTTAAAGKRLGGNASGLSPWSSHPLEAPGRPTIEDTATPCRHGPPAGRLITGFAPRWEGQEYGVLWISGDTVLYDGVRQVAVRIQVGSALLQPWRSSVRRDRTGALHDVGQGRRRLLGLIRPHTVIAIHYEGWTHFRQSRAVMDDEVAKAPAPARESIRWARSALPLTSRSECGHPGPCPRDDSSPPHPAFRTLSGVISTLTPRRVIRTSTALHLSPDFVRHTFDNRL
jgi:L-ascorbate metabolism protein UlaG (beta-lactamase superfamily)